ASPFRLSRRGGRVKENLARLEERWDSYGGNNPIKYRAAIKTAAGSRPAWISSQSRRHIADRASKATYREAAARKRAERSLSQRSEQRDCHAQGPEIPTALLAPQSEPILYEPKWENTRQNQNPRSRSSCAEVKIALWTMTAVFNSVCNFSTSPCPLTPPKRTSTKHGHINDP